MRHAGADRSRGMDHVAIKRLPPVVRCRFDQPAPQVRARVSHQQIDPAELGGCLLDEALDIPLPPNVRDDTTRFHTLFPSFLNHPVEVLRVAGTDPHRATLTR